MTLVQKSMLPSGLRVITERIPHVRSASLGVWVAAGSRLERPDQAGLAHLIEHMLFKGTATRTSRDIARAIDGRGGALNAFTAKEQTCYYARCLDSDLDVAVDLLDDMLRHSLFDPTELAKEKGVVCDEIRMYEDLPDDLAHDLSVGELWPEHPLGRPIAGTTRSVQSFGRPDLLGYMAEHYRDDQVVIAAAGNLEHEWLVERVERLAQGALPTPARGRIEWGPTPAKRTAPGFVLRRKEIEQVHLVLSTAGLAIGDPQALTLQLINCVLGGSSSSRLFQEIRERRGLAYSVYSFHSSFHDTGNCGVYAACSPAQAPEVLALVHELVGELCQSGITEVELEEAKAQLKGQLMLGLESTSARMSRLGRNELSLGYVLTPDEVIARIDRVTTQEAHRLAAEIYQQPGVLSVVGPVSPAFESHGVVKEVLGVG